MKNEFLTTLYTNTLLTANNYNSDNREDLYTPEEEEMRCWEELIRDKFFKATAKNGCFFYALWHLLGMEIFYAAFA